MREVAQKISSSSLDTHLRVSRRMILSPFEHFVEKSRETFFQKTLLSTIILMSNLLKYFF